MRKTILILTFFVTANNLTAQDSCNCQLNLNHMIDKVTNNYAGFKDKVNSSTLAAYTSLTDSLKAAATRVNSLGDCYKLLERYRLWFYDKHLQLRGNLPSSGASTVPNAYSPVHTTWTRTSAYEYLAKNKAALNPIEGFWNTDGYEVAVILNKKTKRYDAVILDAANAKWKEGMLKFTSAANGNGVYKTIYNRGDFARDTVSTTVTKNFLEVSNYGTWQKTFPAVKDSLTAEAYNTNYGGQVIFRMLNNRTVYIRLQSCDLANKPVLDSLLKANAAKLKTIPDWIVDFRGNQGGSTDVFIEMLPYLYTKTFVERGDKHWMTPDNTALLKKFTDENRKVLDKNTITYLDKMVAFGEANPNGWYDDGGDSTKYQKALPFPKRVAVLSDKNNGSSGETFLLVAKGISDKVTTFGQNSAGYMDYGDLLPYSFPCDKLQLYIPSRRSNYLDHGETYSYVGITPDLSIPAGNKDWIKFVFDYWKKQDSSPKKDTLKK